MPNLTNFPSSINIKIILIDVPTKVIDYNSSTMDNIFALKEHHSICVVVTETFLIAVKRFPYRVIEIQLQIRNKISR